MSITDISRPIIFFDGVCNLCNSSVQFVIRHDKKKQFLFAPLQSDAGKKALATFPGTPPDSSLLFYTGKYYQKSDAALYVIKLLGGSLSLLFYAGIIFPRFIRDSVYELVSRNRYKWYGKRSACMIPTPELRARFLS